MKPAPFAYTKARTLKEVVALLSKHRDDARLLAGGQSLIATLNMRLSAPELLIDINGIKGLDGIAKKGKFVEIGALARHTQVEAAAAARSTASRSRTAQWRSAHSSATCRPKRPPRSLVTRR